MKQRADSDILPHDVLSRVFCSGHLSLLDKLRCQEVCTSWNGLLRTLQAPDNLNKLTVEMEVRIYRPTPSERTVLRLHEQPPVVEIKPTEQAGPCQSYLACCQWLTLRSNLFGKLQLDASYPNAWQLQEVLTLLQAACLRSSSKLDLQLLAGKSLSILHKMSFLS